MVTLSSPGPVDVTVNRGAQPRPSARCPLILAAPGTRIPCSGTKATGATTSRPPMTAGIIAAAVDARAGPSPSARPMDEDAAADVRIDDEAGAVAAAQVDEFAQARMALGHAEGQTADEVLLQGDVHRQRGHRDHDQGRGDDVVVSGVLPIEHGDRRRDRPLRTLVEQHRAPEEVVVQPCELQRGESCQRWTGEWKDDLEELPG